MAKQAAFASEQAIISSELKHTANRALEAEQRLAEAKEKQAALQGRLQCCLSVLLNLLQTSATKARS